MTATPGTGLHELLTTAARRTPDSVAVVDGTRTTTYAELEALTRSCVASLRRHGVTAGDRVLLWTEKSAQAIAVMQGCLRLHALYVPVAMSNPATRVGKVAEDCAPTLLVTEHPAPPVAAGGRQVPTVALADLFGDDPLADGHVTGGGVDLPGRTPPQAPAYILYTSGSTGQPKGVLVSHGAALSFVRWAATETALGPGDKLSSHAPFNFDLSVFDIYAAFSAGASIHLVPREQAYNPSCLVEFLHRQAITVWYSVPSALQLMMRDGGLTEGPPPPALRVCVFAGEPFPVAEVHRLREHWAGVRLMNWYGPTETNVCTAYEVTHADLTGARALPIGYPASGDRVAIKPIEGEDTAGEAGTGEIVVSGPSVMSGYWGRPPHTGGYRTGDRGRYAPDGALEYLGRLDTMVKIRGNRVELGEIENALNTHPDLTGCAVLVVGSGLSARLRAVAAARDGHRPSLLALKAHCAARLPAYMVIDELRYEDQLPRTENGKLNRQLLIEHHGKETS